MPDSLSGWRGGGVTVLLSKVHVLVMELCCICYIFLQKQVTLQKYGHLILQIVETHVIHIVEHISLV